MSSLRDHYDVLGIGRNATTDEIRRAHRRLARKFHPDINKDPEAAQRFSEVQAAYDTLSDPQKRAAYDRFGHAGAQAHAGGAGRAGRPGGAPGTGGSTGSWRVEVDPADFSSVFEDLFGGTAQESVGPFGRAGRGSPFGGGRATRGTDHELPLDIDFMTAALGGTRVVHLHGGESIEVRVPAGAQQGATLRVAGRGRPGRGGAAAGDLLLKINIAPHPWFRREGNDIIIDVPISIAEAALGATVTVPLLRGSVDLKIPPGTSSGRRLRVRGQGIAGRAGAKGDFLALISIVAPTTLDAEARDALRTLGARLPDPRADVAWSTATGTEP